MRNIQEKILLLQIQHQRDAQSFTKLYDLLAEPIYRFIFFKVSDAETAQDLTSEVFVKCWKELSGQQGREVKHLKAYIYRIARNIVIDHYRKRELVLVSEDSVLASAQQPQEEHMASTVERKIDSQKMLDLVSKLKTSYQEVIVLRYVEDLSISEIAHIIQKSPVSTRVLVHRANQALKREYEKIA